jgi:hypothetical protein
MTVLTQGRRQFLVGAGGFTLALPLLSSLLPRGARAATAARPRFVCFCTPHGAVNYDNINPPDATLTQTVNLYSDHKIRRGDLKLNVSGGKASLSTILTASSSTLTASLASKMNVIGGLDIPFNIGHHTGGFLGNLARNDGETSGNNLTLEGGYIQTIDQLMAYSPSFYSNTDLSAIKQRSMIIGDTRFSWGYSDPSSKSGTIITVPPSTSSLDLFNKIFVPDDKSTTPVAKRTSVVDRVIDSYNRLRSGAFGDATRLSAADKQRLDEHIQRLNELQRALNAGASATCGDLATPTTDASKYAARATVSDAATYQQLYNEVIAAAFRCGTSRIAVVAAYETFSNYTGDWHQDVAHQYMNADKQQLLVAAQQAFFEDAFLDLATRLDVEEADGQTYLDNSLIMWGQESGPDTHDPQSLPVITAGSAAGFLKTGNYVDYRNRDNTSISHPEWGGSHGLTRPGILYNQWLATVLQAMGVPPSEFERDGKHGYGSLYVDTNYNPNQSTLSWPDRLRNDASKIVPFLGKS